MNEITKHGKTKLNKWLKISLIGVTAILVICFIIHTVVLIVGGSRILNLEKLDQKTVKGIPKEKTDCILILGAGLRNGKPSPMLRERLDLGAALYFSGASDKILVTGDNGSDDYNEVRAMNNYLVDDLGVPGDDIVMDYAGFSTYDSMFRAKEIFCVDSAIIVTQKYHLYRAIYIAENMGINVYGADARTTAFTGRYYREVRECMARIKDFFSCIFKPNPKFLGEKIPIK